MRAPVAMRIPISRTRSVKGAFVKGGGLRFRPIDFYAKNGGLDEMLVNLEIYARLGLVNRYPQLMSHLEWLHGQQQNDGRWNLNAKLLDDKSRWSQTIRLEKDWRSPVRKEADLTFRILLVIKHQWERQIRMLDRRDDTYPI